MSARPPDGADRADPFYRAVRGAFLAAAGPLFRLRVEGATAIPRVGPAVLVARHRSWLDPACVAAACPRPVGFLILGSVYERRWARWFYRRMRSIPVEPNGAGALTAIREALRRLRRGEVVGVFPEGRVFPEHDPGRMHPGAALLALRGAAPVVPLEIRGSARAWPHGRAWPGPARVHVLVGPPVLPPEGARADDAEVARLLERIERALADLAGPRAAS